MKLGELLSHEPFEPIDFLIMYNFLLLLPFLLLPRLSCITLTNKNRIYLILPQLNSMLSVMFKYVS